MRDIILKIIELRNGIRGVDLVLAVMERVNPQRFNTEQYYSDLAELATAKEIQVMEYGDGEIIGKYDDMLGKQWYRVKTMYFTKETLFLNPRRLGDRTNETDKEVLRKS